MAYGKLLYFDFYADRESVKWTVEIHESGYGGSATAMTMGPVPFMIEAGSDVDLFSPHRGSECDLNIAVTSGDDYSFLYTTDARKYLVKIYKYILSSTLYWSGYLLPGQIVDSFKYSRILTVRATDGLGILKEQPYVDDATGLPYDDYEAEIVIIARCLLKTGLELPIRSLVNLCTSESIPIAATNDTLLNAYAQQRRLQDAELNSVSCIDTIDQLLIPLGATIRQSVGVWYILRVAELADATVKYREFDKDGAYVGNGTLTLIKATTSPTGSPLLRQMNDLEIESKKCFRALTTVNDYGLRASIFSGWNFPLNEYDPATTTFRHYTRSASTDWTPYRIKDNWIIKCLTPDEPDHYIETNGIAVGQQAGTAYLTLKLTGGLSSGIPVNQDVRVYLFIFTGADYYYWNGSAWTNTPDADMWQMSIPPASIESPEEWEFDIDPIPVDGTLKIRFYDADNLFFLTKIILKIKEEGYNIATSINSVLIDANNTDEVESITILFGDGYSIDNMTWFSDGMLRGGGPDIANPETTTWRMRDIAGTAYPLVKWLAQGYIDNNNGTSLRGSFIGQFDFHQVLQLAVFGDKLYMPSYITLDPKKMIVSGTFLEVQAKSTAISLTDTYVGPTDVANIKTGGATMSYSGSGGGGGSTVVSFTDYRLATASLTAGANAITYSNTFTIGTSIEVSVLKLLTASGETTGYVLSLESESGFTITVDYDCTLLYLALKTL